jgi:omega-hydroxy-beta-dihydromenaquinone-9 sulfotransferase
MARIGHNLRRLPLTVRMVIYALVFLALMLVVLPAQANRLDTGHPQWHVEIGPVPRGAGAVLFGVSLAAYLYCAYQLMRRGKGAYAEFDPPTEFVAEGPYRWCRNPIAATVVLMLAGLAAARSSTGVALLAVVTLALAHVQVVWLEEPLLRKRFGGVYIRYTRRVSRWIPSRPRPDPAEPSGSYSDHFWIPRFWDGMGPGGYWRLLARNRFDIAPSRLLRAWRIGLTSVFNLAWGMVQRVVYARKIARTTLPDDPVFIIGHWRSGTTLLHELLALDSRHAFPDTYACFAPNHFLVSGWLVKPLMKHLLPPRRPMDNMAAGWDHPQEDEFALCNLGVPSPYLTLAFPNRPPQYPEYLDLAAVPPGELRRWKQTLLRFLQSVTVRHAQRLVLKSPPHTCRIRTLLSMFPKARFVHVVRDPYVLFPSTMSLWRRLYADEGLQKANGLGLEEHVLATLTRMYEALDRDRPLLGPGQLCEVRYEELVADPVAQMARIYESLQIGDFAPVRPVIEAYFKERQDYRPNRYQLTGDQRACIALRWSKYFQDYGYACERPVPSSAAAENANIQSDPTRPGLPA